MRPRWTMVKAGLHVRPIGSFYMLVELRGSRWHANLSVSGPSGFSQVLRLGDGSGCLTLAEGKIEAVAYAQRELGAACRDLGSRTRSVDRTLRDKYRRELVSSGLRPQRVAHYGTNISVDELAPCCVLKGAKEDDVSGPVVQELPPGHVWCSECDAACSGRLTARGPGPHP